MSLMLTRVKKFCNGKNITYLLPMFSSRRFISTQRVIYYDSGDPTSVLQYEENGDAGDDTGKLVVKMLASPINPADINTIQGLYPIRPKTFPAVPGMEGVGVVLKLGEGDNPTSLSEGDLVIPRYPGSGTWRSRVVGENENFIPIPRMDIAAAATLAVNPCTAFRLLQDFAELEPGDTVIQNGGNSAVGQGVIQLCREMGLKCISIVRNRENIAEVKRDLESLGDDNTLILTEEELRLYSKKLRAQLALNCVGGKPTTEMLRTLESGGVMVTYGGMSKQPIIVPTSHLIFKGIALQGFWMTRWNHVTPVAERMEMLNYLAKLCNEGKYKTPSHTLVHVSDYKLAVETAMKEFKNTKILFTFD